MNYKVICDNTNNTPETIARHELHVDLELDINPTYRELYEYIEKEVKKHMEIDVIRTQLIRQLSKLPDHLFEPIE